MKLSFISLLAAFFLVSIFDGCRKLDFKDDHTGSPEVKAIEWKTVYLKKSGAANQNIYSTAIADQAITDEIVKKGLVLVYHKISEGVRSLPYEQEQLGNSIIFEYRVSKGSLYLVLNSVLSVGDPDKEIHYFILNPTQLEQLQQKGVKKSDLLGADINNVKEIFETL
jgi:hypothetical protein